MMIDKGTLAEVKLCRTMRQERIIMKILNCAIIIKHKMADQIKREISIMKLVRHLNVVRLHEVLASRKKIYIILEFITGGELFDKIVHQGKLNENDSRGYFQQLIDGVDYCHSKGVYHRDLKPENLLLDSQGNLKISDFGLSALRVEGVKLLKTTCGTPNYVAPEVLGHKGYDGAIADIWSCGVILYVLLAGYLPFDEVDLGTLYSKIEKAEFSCPSWLSMGAKSLIQRILDPNPDRRIQIEDIRNDDWFKKNYVPARFDKDDDVNFDDVCAVFDDPEVKDGFVDACTRPFFDLFSDQQACEPIGNDEASPLILNAFDLIILSQGLNLSTLFERTQDNVNQQTRFLSQKPAKVLLSSMEVVAQSMGFKTHIRNFKMRVEGAYADRISHFSVMLEIFEVAPSLYMVDIRRAAGDAEEYLKFSKSFCDKLDDIIWRAPAEKSKSRVLRRAFNRQTSVAV